MANTRSTARRSGRWVVYGLAAAALAVAAWLSTRGEPAAGARFETRPSGSASASTARRARPRPPVRGELRGEALQARVDEGIPRQLLAHAAPCYEEGVPGEPQLRLAVQVRASRGQVAVVGVKVIEDAIDDDEIQRCIV